MFKSCGNGSRLSSHCNGVSEPEREADAGTVIGRIIVGVVGWTVVRTVISIRRVVRAVVTTVLTTIMPTVVAIPPISMVNELDLILTA